MDTRFEVLEFTDGDVTHDPDYTYEVGTLAEAGGRIEQEMRYNTGYDYRGKTVFRVVRVDYVETRTDIPFRLGGVVFD